MKTKKPPRCWNTKTTKEQRKNYNSTAPILSNRREFYKYDYYRDFKAWP